MSSLDMLQAVTGVVSGAVGADTGTYGAGKLAGWVLSETSGAAVATVNVRDGGAAGAILFRFNLAASGTVVFAPAGKINFPGGDAYFEILAGAVRWTALKA